MFYTSNERDYCSLSVDIFDSENKHKSKKICKERYFFTFIFQSSISHQIMFLEVYNFVCT